MTQDSAHSVPPRRIPIYSLKGPSDEATEALRTLPYLTELERQAVIVNNNIASAWRLAMSGRPADDPETWAALQAALFGAIIVQRILKPVESVKKYPHHETRGESQRFAKERGQRLRKLLGVPDDAPFFWVADVRDPFEHVDERLDHLMRPDIITVADWYISDGSAFITPAINGSASADGSNTGYGLRVFFPAGGLLLFDDKVLDLYVLDIAMLDLQNVIAEVRPTVEAVIKGRNAFGGHKVVELLGPELTRMRAETWLSDRDQRGHGLGVQMVEAPNTPNHDS